MPVNNNRPFFNTRRIIKELPKAVIENKLEEVKPEVVVAETLKQADEDFVSFYDLDSKLLLDMNNIHIISRVTPDDNITHNNNGDETIEDFISRLEGNEFDKEVDLQALTIQIDELFSIFKNSYNFDESFMDTVLNFVKEKIISDKTSNKNYNLKDILKQFIENIQTLLNVHEINNAQHVNENGVVIYNLGFGAPRVQTQSEAADEMDIFSTSYLKSDDIQHNFLITLFKDAIKECSLNDRESTILINRICNNITEKIGLDNPLTLTLSDFAKLDNSDGTFFDELYSIIQEEISKIQTVDRNAETFDIEILMGGKDSVTAEDIMSQYDDFMLCNDGGIRRLMTFLKDNFELEETKYLNILISFINDKYDVQNTTPPTLTKEVLEKLNNDGIFNILENIMESEEYKNIATINLNGEIETSVQGVGDCWLLSGINALNATEAGREILKNAISIDNENRTVTVTFAGVPISYTISFDELLSHDPDCKDKPFSGTNLSSGDNDVLVLEIATSKLRQDIANGIVTVPDNYSWNPRSGQSVDSMNNIEGGWSKDFIYWLTGYNNNSLDVKNKNNVPDHIVSIYQFLFNNLEKFNNGELAMYFSIDKASIAKQIGGLESRFQGTHAYAIVGMTEGTITFIDPNNSTYVYTLTWEEFAKLDIMEIGYTNLVNPDDVYELKHGEGEVYTDYKGNRWLYINEHWESLEPPEKKPTKTNKEDVNIDINTGYNLYRYNGTNTGIFSEEEIKNEALEYFTKNESVMNELKQNVLSYIAEKENANINDINITNWNFNIIMNNFGHKNGYTYFDCSFELSVDYEITKYVEDWQIGDKYKNQLGESYIMNNDGSWSLISSQAVLRHLERN